MATFRLRWIKAYTDRHGRQRHYYRRPGCPSVPLPGEPGSKAFMEAYHAAASAERPPIGEEREKAGSFGALIAAYYKSKDYRSLSDSAKRSYRQVLEQFRAQYADMAVATLRRDHVVSILDKLDDKPGVQLTLRKRLNTLLNFAADRGWRKDNPITGMRRKRQASEGFRAWTEDDIDVFMRKWPAGSRERLAMLLLLCTAQRRSDVHLMGRQHVKGARIHVAQAKGGGKTRLWIPLHSTLKTELANVPPGQMTFVQTQYGQPFSASGFTNWFSEKAQEAGLPPGSTPHGLRKAGARRLAEAGCTPHQIMAVTGHKNLSEVTLYTAAADQERLAAEAMDKAERGTETSNPKRPGRQS